MIAVLFFVFCFFLGLNFYFYNQVCIFLGTNRIIGVFRRKRRFFKKLVLAGVLSEIPRGGGLFIISQTALVILQ